MYYEVLHGVIIGRNGQNDTSNDCILYLCCVYGHPSTHQDSTMLNGE